MNKIKPVKCVNCAKSYCHLNITLFLCEDCNAPMCCGYQYCKKCRPDSYITDTDLLNYFLHKNKMSRQDAVRLLKIDHTQNNN